MEPQELEGILDRLGVKDHFIANYIRYVELEKKKDLTEKEKREKSQLQVILASIKVTAKHEFPFMESSEFWNAAYKLSPHK